MKMLQKLRDWWRRQTRGVLAQFVRQSTDEELAKCLAGLNRTRRPSIRCEVADRVCIIPRAELRRLVIAEIENRQSKGNP